MLLLLVIFGCLFIQLVVFSCCTISGKDPLYRKISDQEQMAFIEHWNASHKMSAKPSARRAKNEKKDRSN